MRSRVRVFLNEAVSSPLAEVVIRANETLLLAARGSVRQAVAVLAHVARPAAFCWMRCSRTLRRYVFKAFARRVTSGRLASDNQP